MGINSGKLHPAGAENASARYRFLMAPQVPWNAAALNSQVCGSNSEKDEIARINSGRLQPPGVENASPHYYIFGAP